MKQSRKNLNEVSDQIRRLSAIGLMSDIHQEELTTLSVEIYQNVTAMRADIDEIVKTFEKVPTPRQLREFSQRHATPPKVGCPECDFTGWHHVTRNGHSAVERCKGVAA